MSELNEQQALDTMRAETYGPLTEGDQAAHDALQAEVSQQAETVNLEPDRAQKIGGEPVKVLIEQDGVLIPQEQWQDMKDAGQDITVHSTAGRRN